MQTDSYRSPLEKSSPNQSMDLSPEVTTANGYVRPSGSNENTSSGCGMYKDYHQCYSPSSFGTKRTGKPEQIKGRLEFDDSSAAVNSELCILQSPGPATVGKRGGFDIDDLLNYTVLDSDVSLSYLIDFELNSQVSALADQSSLHSAIKFISSPSGEEERNLKIDGAFPNFLLLNAVVLSERDMNHRTDDDSAQLSKPWQKKTKAFYGSRKCAGIMTSAISRHLPLCLAYHLNIHQSSGVLKNVGAR